MKTLIGAAVVAGVLAFAGPVAIDSAAAAAPLAKTQTAGVSGATDISARRYHRHYRYGYYPRYDRYRPFIRLLLRGPGTTGPIRITRRRRSRSASASGPYWW